MKKLENNVLEGVNIGDNLCLKADNGDFVSGFVVKSSVGMVKLSHEHPRNEKRKIINYSLSWTRGDRYYHLGEFSEYEIIKPTNNKKQD